MFALGGLVALVILGMQVLAGRRDGLVAEIVPHVTQVHFALGHVRAGGMPQPMRGARAQQLSAGVKRLAASLHTLGGPLEDLLDDEMNRASRERSSLAAHREEEGSGLARHWKWL